MTLVALYRPVNSAEWRSALTTNLSESGVLFEAADALAVDSLVELVFDLPEPLGSLPAGHVTCTAKVTRRPRPTAAVQFPTAAQFIGLCSEPKRRLPGAWRPVFIESRVSRTTETDARRLPRASTGAVGRRAG